jgi:hypothetical protein
MSLRGKGTVRSSGSNSAAVFAQTVNGDGGKGGNAWSAVWPFPGRNSKTGGAGGAGGQIDVGNQGDWAIVNIGPFNAHGIYVRSIGGRGGDGGRAAGTESPERAASGGSAPNIVFQTASEAGLSITTQGVNSHGLFLSQRSGEGGTGGNGNGSRFGATGGNGGAGGQISVANQGNWTIVNTGASDAMGIYLNSIGGNGGSGGQGAGATGGGNGGSGGKAPDIVFEMVSQSNLSIITEGSDSHGLFLSAQSGNGGDQGTGGTNPAGGTQNGGGTGADGSRILVNLGGNLSSTTKGTNSAGLYAFSRAGDGGVGRRGTLGKGGVGGFGGTGGAIIVTVPRNSAAITTSEDGASGVLLQSEGGNGGDGGSSTFNNGASGGWGGGGGFITLDGNWNIATGGVDAHGIAAYSLGGVGGAGGKGGLFGRGGQGGNNTVSGSVGISPHGSIQTSGESAYGILAQSIAGYAGDGGRTIGFIPFAHEGGSAGGGGPATIDNAASISTGGEQAMALVAQSIGGGGGNGGKAFGVFYSEGAKGGAGGPGGAVRVTNAGDLTTSGNDATAIVAQSIGGTGGNGGLAGGLTGAFGGGGGLASDGGAVRVRNTGEIETGKNGVGGQGDPSITNRVCGIGCSEGIFAQSIGGGGGKAGTAGGGWVGLGGSGGDGGNGAQVTVNNSNRITTALKSSGAIEAQSLGGGGGKAGGAFALGFGASVAVGGRGGKGGDGGPVTVTNLEQGALMTSGESSPGIFAQSEGGGGGVGGFAVSVTGGVKVPALAIGVGGAGGVAGDGEAVTVFDAANITTTGRDSAGIYAQSQGGGGGKGGFAVTASGSNVGAVSVSVGGEGDAGGHGGVTRVIVQDGTMISTRGGNPLLTTNSSPGIYAQSGGGKGGDGGFSVAVGAAEAGATFAIGGKGGKGGSGSLVDVVVGTGSISTTAGNSRGIDAQSVGGGGGNGAFALSLLGGSGKVGALTLAMGGDGNGGGAGGPVFVNNKAAIRTNGWGSTGLFAQSQGGGGGNGGMSVSGGVFQTTGDESLAVNISAGGEGGDGGIGDSVTVQNDGNISVSGLRAMGIQAMSVGKGGGNGGMSLVGTIEPGNAGKTFRTRFALGGAGGGGGGAKEVKVTNTGNITTLGLDNGWGFVSLHNYGIFAQSVGGGGGNGGLAGILSLGQGAAPDGLDVEFNMAVGGEGGGGGKGGQVDVTNFGVIKTIAGSSSAIFAQSISDGGGNGGQSLSYIINKGQPGNTKNVAVNVNVGGAGGDGNVGGKVNVVNNGTLDTSGHDSHGITVQSVGGGGGNGGNVSGLFLERLPLSGGVDEKTYKATIKLGGTGGKGNDGGVVTVGNTANIITTGSGSNAIYAQSVGGGGGNGGGDSGYDSGGGRLLGGIPNSLKPKWTELNLSLGGDGGAQGDGGNVNVTQYGSRLATRGLSSAAIYAQSVGGGGGTVLTGRGGTISGGRQPFTISLGGKGAAGGNGGDVTVKLLNGAQIVTSDEPVFNGAGELQDDAGSYGIFAQSIGGGGGVGGSGKLQGIPGGAEIPGCDICGEISFGWGIGLSKGGGKGGDGGAVTVDVKGGSITTGGDSSPAIFAQSVGGGGGIAGVTALSPLTTGGFIESVRGTAVGSGGDVGSGGIVKIDYAGLIATTGDASHGIFAQSVGGGKETAGNADLRSLGKAVTIDFAGNLTATGEDAHGILAQSGGADGAGDITVNIAQGSLVSGGKKGMTNNAAGVMFMDGAANRLTNSGTITSVAGSDRVAVAHTGIGTVTVENNGTIDGRVLLGTGAGANRLFNRIGGAVQADLIDLGGGVLVNDGVLYPGGEDQVGLTRIEGVLIQGESGLLEVDLNHARSGQTAGTESLQSDLLSTTSAIALAGKVRVNLVDDGSSSGEQTVAIIEAASGERIDAAALSVVPSAVAQYRLVQPSQRQLALRYDIDFANPGILTQINDNQDSIARHIEGIYSAGALDDTTSNELIAVADTEAYAQIMNSLSAEIAVDNQISSLLSGIRFNDALLSCAERAGDYRFFDQGQCGWLRLRGQYFEQDATSDNLGFDENSWQLAGGGQFDVGNGWHLGGALSYEWRNLNADDSNASSDGGQFQAGVSAKRRFQATELSGSLAVGYGDFDIDRTPWPGVSTEGEQKLWLYSAQVRVAHLLERGRWSLKSRLDLGMDYLSTGGYSESGDSDFRFRVDGDNGAYVNVQPAIDIATEIETDDGMLIRPKLTLGITQFLSDAAPSVTGRFAAAPAAVAPFTASTELDKTRFDVAAGVDVFTRNDIIVRAKLFGSFSDNSSSYGGGLKVAMPF